MTLCASVMTGDGLVMGADSMTVVREANMSKTFSNATKVFEVPGLPIVVMTYGLGAFGRRSIESLIDEWNTTRPGFEKSAYTVHEVAEHLGKWIFQHHDAWLKLLRDENAQQQGQALVGGNSADTEEVRVFDPNDFMTGIVVGGYQSDSFFPWLWTWEQPAAPGAAAGLICTRSHEGPAGIDGPQSGLDYWGETTAIRRLVQGYDDRFIEALKISKCLDAEMVQQLEEAAADHKWRLVSEGMPVQDAVDLLRFVLQVGSGYERFRDGTQQIGGEFDIAVVRHNAVHWIARKPLTAALASMNGSPTIHRVRSAGDPKGKA